MLTVRKFSIKIITVLIIVTGSGFMMNDFFQFTLKDIQNHPVSLSSYKNKKATVVILLLSDCPASQSYTLTLNKLAGRFAKDSIGFIGVFPGKFSKDDELKKFRTDYKVAFPLLKDPEMALVKYLHATVAPECFVIDHNSKTVYHGRIDDWLYTIGKKRMQITENNLEDAIKAVIANTHVKIAETKPIGCILEYE